MALDTSCTATNQSFGNTPQPQDHFQGGPSLFISTSCPVRLQFVLMHSGTEKTWANRSGDSYMAIDQQVCETAVDVCRFDSVCAR